MGQGMENKTRTDPKVEIQERGDIFFFYRPKVNRDEAHSADDVQRMYMVLRPESGEKLVELKQDSHSGKEATAEESGDDREESGSGGHGSQQVDIEKQPMLRFIVMGRKSLPDPTKKSTPFWGFVELVTTDIQHIKSALKGEEYDTATRGHRHVADCRAVGEGVYRILRHNSGSSKMHTHLIYKLEYPVEGEEGEPQEALNISREASFLIQIKNPDQNAGSSSSQFRGLKKKRKAAFPAQLQGQFGHLRYKPADPPDFLNYEGCEFLLVSASDDIEQELGLELKTEENDECSDLVDTFGETAASTRPLFHGTWA